MAHSVDGAAVDVAAARVAPAARTGRRLVADAELPSWMRPLVQRADGTRLADWILRAAEPAPPSARHGAVLMLLAQGASGPDLLITSRAVTLRSHAGQPAFPGGALEPGESDVQAALREAHEETALDPNSVIPAALLPQLYLPPSGFVVRPVLALWALPGPIRAVDPAETARVSRVPVAQLADPANRGSVLLPAGGARGLRRELRTPAFRVDGMTVWGFTAGLVDLILDWGGWAVPWDRQRQWTPESMTSAASSAGRTAPATALDDAAVAP